MFYLINKQSGLSSFQAIRQFAKKHNFSKIGHSGTLDPLARGLLLVATNESTKLLSYVAHTRKTYEVEFEIGKTSSTYDVEGEICLVKTEIFPNEQAIHDALRRFIGKQLQTPPLFSAKKVQGKTAYSLARQGIQVKLASVGIEIFKIDNFKKTSDHIFQFTTEVSAGTYIRSLINDLGNALGCGAIMTNLRRTRIGELTTDKESEPLDWRQVLDLPILEINSEFAKKLKNGQKLDWNEENKTFALTHQQVLFGIAKVENGKLVPIRILNNVSKEDF